MTLPSLAFDYSNRTTDADGRLHVAVTNISKANVCPYKGSEIPDWQALGLDPNRIYRLFRDPAELAAAAPTFNNIPLLSRHVAISADEPKHDLVMGSTGTDAIFVDPYLKNSLVIWDAVAIAGVNSGDQKELSCAYRYRADMTPGENGGFIYDGIMREIVGNHVALVEAGRAGSDVVVGDSKLETGAMPKVVLKSRAALMMKGALTAYAAPKLAQDAKIDIGSILTDFTKENWADQKAGLTAALTKLTKGKLAKDAELDSGEIADIVEAVAEAVDDDEDEDMAGDADPDETEEECKARLAKEKVAKDKKAKDTKKAADAKKAKDADPDPDDEDDKKKDGKAMDAALKAVEVATITRMNDRDAAKEDVRPYVGAVMGMDSAAAVYKFALDHLKVDTTDVHPSAFRAILKAQPMPGSAAPRAKIAMDGADDDFKKRFPNAALIGHA